jgi:hypothetical protein
MKKQLYTLLLLFSAVAGLGSLFLSCDSDDDFTNCQGIDCLPPATTTGEGTFGCLVNGEPFVDNSGSFNCFYQLVDGEYFFSISAENTEAIPRNIRLSTNSLELFENNNYQLIEPFDGNAHAAVIFYFQDLQANENTTNQEHSGSISITRLDLDNNIVSGTFNFNIQDTITGKVYNLTNGRFDSFFTQ